MPRRTSWLIIAGIVGGWFAAAATSFSAPDGGVPHDDTDVTKLLKSFQERLDAFPGSAESREAAKARLAAVLAAGEDPSFAITETLMAWSPDYGAAIALADEGKMQDAEQALQPFLQSDEPFVAADATYVLARTLVAAEDFERAAPLLEQLTGDRAPFTLNAGIARYYLGLTQARMLRNADAIESFSMFLQQYPQAPERLRVSAWQQIQELSSIVQGELNDVHQRMDFSRRKLTLEDSGDSTQDQQSRIVDLLAKLIREQEKRECSSSSQKNSKNQGQQQAKQEAKRPDEPQQSQSQTGGVSNNPNGVATRTFSDGPASPWSRLRDRSRDPAYSAIKDQLPAKYREIVERYTEKAQADGSGDDSK